MLSRAAFTLLGLADAPGGLPKPLGAQPGSLTPSPSTSSVPGREQSDGRQRGEEPG